MKGGSGATQQEPYNEVLASSVMERLGIPHVTYTLTVQEDYPYSVCEDFITPETELIPAWYIMQTVKRPNHVSVYQHYMDCCEALGIPGVREAVDRMIVLDYLIVNEDRHQNNFEQRVAHLLRDSLRVQPEDYEAMNVCLREQAQAAAEVLLEQGMKLDGYLAWAAKQNVLLDTQAQEILDRLAEQQAQVNSAPEQNGPVLGGMSL